MLHRNSERESQASFTWSSSSLGAAFRLIFVAVMTANSLNYFGLLNLFNSARSASAFDAGYDTDISPSSGRRSVTIYSFPIFWFLRSSEKGRSRFGLRSSG